LNVLLFQAANSDSILDRIAGSGRLHLILAAELRMLCDELEKLPYQILAGRREGDNGDQIEILVTYSKEA